jgi:hypothetical protein
MSTARVPLDGPARGVRGSQHLTRLRKEGHQAPGSRGQVSAQDNGIGALACVSLRPRRCAPPGGGDRGEGLRPECQAAFCTAARELLARHIAEKMTHEDFKLSSFFFMMTKIGRVMSSCT